MPATAAKLSCQPTSCQARGSSAERHHRGEQQRIAARREPAGECSHDAASAHHPRPHDRRARRPSRARKAGSGTATPIRRPCRARPAAASSGHRAAASSATFCPLTASTCVRPERLEVIAHTGRDVLVGAQHHAAGQGAQRRRQSGAHTPLGAPAHLVDRSPCRRRCDAPVRGNTIGVKDGANTRAAQICDVVEATLPDAGRGHYGRQRVPRRRSRRAPASLPPSLTWTRSSPKASSRCLGPPVRRHPQPHPALPVRGRLAADHVTDHLDVPGRPPPTSRRVRRSPRGARSLQAPPRAPAQPRATTASGRARRHTVTTTTARKAAISVAASTWPTRTNPPPSAARPTCRG